VEENIAVNRDVINIKITATVIKITRFTMDLDGEVTFPLNFIVSRWDWADICAAGRSAPDPGLFWSEKNLGVLLTCVSISAIKITALKK
jgi:hypothetical protein